jgi:hypothetical protein
MLTVGYMDGSGVLMACGPVVHPAQGVLYPWQVDIT